MNDLLILTLLEIPQLSRRVIYKLIETNKKEDFQFSNIINLIIKAKKINSKIIIPNDLEIEAYKKKSEEKLKRSQISGIENITILDEDFPKRLKVIKDAPVILFYKGNKECILDEKAVAIIGTREPTECGIKIAEKLGKIFGEDGYVVVSGLANGCDEYGHKGCVEVRGRSIAILPCGLDTIYPPSNKLLAKQILDNNGCLISEYPIGKRTFKNTLIERDRLQSAFSQAVIVIETAIKGGTMHTVQFALEQDKIVVSYKHTKEYSEDMQTKGNQKLINEKKAIGIYSKRDITKLKNMIEEKIKSNKKQDFMDQDIKDIAIQESFLD